MFAHRLAVTFVYLLVVLEPRERCWRVATGRHAQEFLTGTSRNHGALGVAGDDRS